MNAQPWHFVIIESEGRSGGSVKREKKGSMKKLPEGLENGSIKGFTWEKPFLSEAPYLVLVFVDMKAPFTVYSTWIALGLALEEEGMGTVTYTPPNGNLVNAPKNYLLQTILPIGYPGDEKPKYGRKKLEDVVSFESFKPRP
ncbi:nitroreductase family protein [Palaeococcus sp. (in: euryarchaeotes)]